MGFQYFAGAAFRALTASDFDVIALGYHGASPLPTTGLKIRLSGGPDAVLAMPWFGPGVDGRSARSGSGRLH